jgi:hypothetical protein
LFRFVSAAVKSEGKSATATIITFAQQVVANDNANDRCHRQRLFSDRETRTGKRTAAEEECRSFAAAQQVATQIFKVILTIGRLIIVRPDAIRIRFETTSRDKKEKLNIRLAAAPSRFSFFPSSQRCVIMVQVAPRKT